MHESLCGRLAVTYCHRVDPNWKLPPVRHAGMDGKSALTFLFVMWGESRMQSTWLRGLPAAEGTAGDCFLGLHPEYVSARCSELHAEIRLKAVEFRAKFRSLFAIVMSCLEIQSEQRRLRRKVWLCLSGP